MFSIHLRHLIQTIEFQPGKLTVDTPFVPTRYLLLRDGTYFRLLWFGGDRGGDLGKTIGKEISELQDGSLYFNHTVSKTVHQSGGSFSPCAPSPKWGCGRPVAIHRWWTGPPSGRSPRKPMRRE